MISYPIELTPDDNDTFLATCPDLPEVTSFGETEAETLAFAAQALEEALAGRLTRFAEIPEPGPGAPRVEVSLQTTLKLNLYAALRSRGWTRADLARALDWKRPQVDRLFDADHATRNDQFDSAFKALEVSIEVKSQTFGESCAQMMEEMFDLQRQVYVDGESIIFGENGEYEIPLGAIHTDEDVIRWANQLGEKTWVSKDMLLRFIALANDAKGTVGREFERD